MIHATAIGNLGGDAEIRLVGERSVCSFSVGTKSRKDGPTTWVRCSLWGKRGESLRPYLLKGGRVAAVGTLSAKEHNGKTYVELEVSEIELLGDKPGVAGAGRRDAHPDPAARDAEEVPLYTMMLSDGVDLPF